VLAASLPGLLAPGGAAVLELGIGQRPAVEALASAAGLRPAGCRADLGGIERALVLRGPPGGAQKKPIGAAGPAH
jgi:release factor glutamine methyltransferase